MKKTDIAVIGMACRLPAAADYRQFWANLVAGTDAVREIPPDRWDNDNVYAPNPGETNRSISKWCGSIDGIDRFDHRFFRISPREAKCMDPQQRLLLEETWHCLEDAGIEPGQLRQERTGVYVGTMSADYLQEAAAPGQEVDGYSALGNYECILANRISHFFGLQGPSFSINAACASSLVAVHQARLALASGECRFALAAGVSLNSHPFKYLSFSKARMLSPVGRCKTFDVDADGYVPGEGVGVLLLQPLAEALAEGRHIHGVLTGSAVNHTGPTRSITAPRMEAQRDVILAAYEGAGFTPRSVTYVEAHGTGTSLGDPDRGGSPDAGISAKHERAWVLPYRVGQNQYRPSGSGCRCRRPDQGVPDDASSPHPDDPQRRETQPHDQFRQLSFHSRTRTRSLGK